MLINNAARLDLVLSDPWRVIHLHFLPLSSPFLPSRYLTSLQLTHNSCPLPWPILGHLFFYQNNLPTCHPPPVTFSSSIHSPKLTWKGVFFISVLPCPQDYTCREEEKCLVLFMSDLYHNHDSIAYWVIRVSQCRPEIPGGQDSHHSYSPVSPEPRKIFPFIK